jgi:hypothetical protein
MQFPALLLLAAAAVVRGQPALPYLDWKACPFEGCAYGEWTARKSVTVYDTWKAPRRPFARLSPGDRVKAETGLVVTYRPGVIRIDRDLPEQRLKRGEKILTYAYRGEGVYAAFVHGRYEPEFEVPPAKWPAIASACEENGSCAIGRTPECFLQCVGGPGCAGNHCPATFLSPGKKEWWARIILPGSRAAWIQVNPADFEGIALSFLTAPEYRRSSSLQF